MAELMDHDEVREWLDEAFLAPGMRDDDDRTARAVRAHLETCPACGAYDEATRLAALKLDLVRGPAPEVRTRTMAAAQRLARARSGMAGTAAQQRTRGGLTWRLATLVLAVAMVGAGAGAWWANAARPDSDHLADAVAMMSTLATEAGAHEVILRDAAGTGNGLAVMSATTHQLAVFATHLPAAVEFHCYIEHRGERIWIGSMYVDGGVQFWAGAMESGIDMQSGDVLIVAADETQPAVLSATL
jgi:hypothetical protein